MLKVIMSICIIVAWTATPSKVLGSENLIKYQCFIASMGTYFEITKIRNDQGKLIPIATMWTPKVSTLKSPVHIGGYQVFSSFRMYNDKVSQVFSKFSLRATAQDRLEIFDIMKLMDQKPTLSIFVIQKKGEVTPRVAYSMGNDIQSCK